jgi:hypothetical protein
MKDEASLYNEWLHKNLMQLEYALFSIVGEERHILRRAWRTLPPIEEDGHVVTAAERRSSIAERRSSILLLLGLVKKEIEAAAAGAAQ